MLKLKTTIIQLNNDEYAELVQLLTNNKGTKYLTLLQHYRDNNLSDIRIREQLDVKPNAFYTLKSRLYHKIQEILITNIKAPSGELLRKIAAIPQLLINTERTTAIATLTKLEKDLLDRDMPYELSCVYKALKKLHHKSSKYSHYSKLYDKYAAYKVNLDKIEDLLLRFNHTLGEYYISRNPGLKRVMLSLKREMQSIHQTYQSHHTYVYQGIASVSYALFLNDQKGIEEDEAIEDTLSAINAIFDRYPNDTNYQFLKLVLDFLAFEYYHQLGIVKKEVEYFDAIHNNLSCFLLHTFCTFPSKYFISKIQRYESLGILSRLYKENKTLLKDYHPNKEDVPNYVNYTKYMAMSAFYSGEYEEGLQTLKRMMQELSLRRYMHLDIEIRLLLALFYSMLEEYEAAHVQIKTVSRKLREAEDIDYEHVRVFLKLLQTPLRSNVTNVYEKLHKLNKRFYQMNVGEFAVLEYLFLDESMLKQLSRVVKTGV